MDGTRALTLKKFTEHGRARGAPTDDCNVRHDLLTWLRTACMWRFFEVSQARTPLNLRMTFRLFTGV